MKYDVIIVGGGPGGCSAASMLAKQGKKVLIHEKRKKGSLIPCGGITKPDFFNTWNFPVDEYKKLGVKIEKYIEVQNGEISKHTKMQDSCYGVARSKTDLFFENYAIQCGAVIKFESTVNEIKKKNGIFEILGDEAEYVIIACGALPAITLNGEMLPHSNNLMTGMSAEIKGKKADVPFYLENYSYENPKEYSWITSLGEDLYNVGIVLFDGSKVRNEFWSFVNTKLKEYIGEDFEFLSDPQGRLLGIGENIQVDVDGLFMIGDAANSTSDHGEGIRQTVFDADQVVKCINYYENKSDDLGFDKALDWYVDEVYSKYIKPESNFEDQKYAYKIYEKTFNAEDKDGVVCCEFPIIKKAMPDVSFEYYLSQFLYENPLWNTLYKKTGEKLQGIARILKKYGKENATLYTEMDTSDGSKDKASFFICVGDEGFTSEMLSEMDFGFDGELIASTVEKIQDALAPHILFFPIFGYMESRESKCVRLTLKLDMKENLKDVLSKVNALVNINCPKELLDSLEEIDNDCWIQRKIDFDLFEDGSIGSTFGLELLPDNFKDYSNDTCKDPLESASFFNFYETAIKLGIADETIYKIPSMFRSKTFADMNPNNTIIFNVDKMYFKLTFKDGKLKPMKAYYAERIKRDLWR